MVAEGGVIPAYGDGNFAGWRWQGTANASGSELITPRTTDLTLRYLEGSGFPEGVVPAPVGTRYIDTAATAGAVEWIKTGGGFGATGWKVKYGDTGVRDLQATADWDFTTATNDGTQRFYLRRIGAMVWTKISFRALVQQPTQRFLCTMPADFRPWTTEAFGATNGSNFDRYQGGITIAATTGVINVAPAAAGQLFTVTCVYPAHTSSLWPATLPGV
jgi:hypothetical protein